MTDITSTTYATDHEWALARQAELNHTADIDQLIEVTDLRGALTRMKRTPQHGGAWSAAYRTLHNWRFFRDETLAARKANPTLVAQYTQLLEG